MPDDNGYPTPDELNGLRTFTGTWREYMAYIRSIGNYWPSDNTWGWRESEVDGLHQREMLYEISTGGWSGNEEIVGLLQDEPLWFMFWEQSQRGGHYKISIPLDQLDTPVWHLEEAHAPS